jgi:hypothetical protein
MAQIRIPCLVGKTNKAGITSWYWQPSATLARAGWKPISLGKDRSAAMATAEKRNEEVKIWKAGGTKPPQIRTKAQPATFGALIDRYRREKLEGKKPNGQPLLREKTRAVYETSLKRLEFWAGKHPVTHYPATRACAARCQCQAD